MAFRQITAHCVACHAPLELVRTGDYEYQRCAGCLGSLWMVDNLQAAFAAAQPHRRLELALHNDGSRRRDCPVCHDKMDIAWVEFLQLQSCENHGIWLHNGALEQLLAYDVRPAHLPTFKQRKKKR